MGYDVIETRGSGLGTRDSGIEETEDLEQQARDREYRALRFELILGTALAIPVVVLGMAHVHFPGVNGVQLALSAPVLFFCGWQFYRGAWKAVRHRTADMNTLIAVGTGAAFIYSYVATIAPAAAVPPTRTSSAATSLHPSTSKRLSSSSSPCCSASCRGDARGRTSAATSSGLMRPATRTARITATASSSEQPTRDVLRGDIACSCAPGERLPVDGEVMRSRSTS